MLFLSILLIFYSIFFIWLQVDLLLSFVSHDSAASLKARALKCLSFLTGSGACFVSVNRRVLFTLIHIVDDNDIPVDFQCEALRILCKVLINELLFSTWCFWCYGY